MNRKDVVRDVAQARAAEFRAMLQADATAELAEQGTAPTWRMPDVATVTLPVSREKAVVIDEHLLLSWVKRRHPHQIEERVRRGFLAVVDNAVRVEDGQVIDPDGEIVPGMSVREGGIPGTLRITAADTAKALLASEADAMMTAIASALGEPHGGEPT